MLNYKNTTNFIYEIKNFFKNKSQITDEINVIS